MTSNIFTRAKKLLNARSWYSKNNPKVFLPGINNEYTYCLWTAIDKSKVPDTNLATLILDAIAMVDPDAPWPVRFKGGALPLLKNGRFMEAIFWWNDNRARNVTQVKRVLTVANHLHDIRK